MVRVSDTGPGISDGNAGRIFDRFFTTARDRGGTGLGLPIMRSRLAATGATIELARNRSRGRVHHQAAGSRHVRTGLSVAAAGAFHVLRPETR